MKGFNCHIANEGINCHITLTFPTSMLAVVRREKIIYSYINSLVQPTRWVRLYGLGDRPSTRWRPLFSGFDWRGQSLQFFFPTHVTSTSMVFGAWMFTTNLSTMLIFFNAAAVLSLSLFTFIMWISCFFWFFFCCLFIKTSCLCITPCCRWCSLLY